MLAFALALALQDETVTVGSLLREMTDLDRLWRPVASGGRLRQFSSYDRASRVPADAESWFANGDCGNYLGTDRIGDQEWFLLADAEGPGAILRIWSANPAGDVRIELDGAPVVEASFRDLLTGSVAPFLSPLAGERSRGCNLYFPIPFARRARVLTSEGGQYYHVGVRTFPPGTRVETVTAETLAAAAGEIESVRAALSPEACAAFSREGLNAAGTDVGAPEPIELEGPGIIECVELLAGADPAADALRGHTLTIRFDDELCVWSPLGDFFATAPGLGPYASLPIAIERDNERTVARCRFPMPFARSARIEVAREGGEPLVARLNVFWRTDPRAAEGLRFHALWRGATVPTRPFTDWTALLATGSGRVVGIGLFVRNPVRAWWGEGDEKIFIDREAFPSTFGTGTEDYFGYAWCDPTPFSHAYHGQTRCDGPGNRGFTSVYRFHILDDIPWSHSIRFDLEVWHWADVPLGFATIAYAYAEPGARFAFEPTPAAERLSLTGPFPGRRRVEGAIEGESVEVVQCTRGEAGPQDMEGFVDGWSGDSHLWWRGARPGDRLDLAFDSPIDGEATLVLAMTRAPDYGIVRLRLGDTVLSNEVDLWAERVEPAGPREFAVTLARGRNVLTIEVVATNPRASPRNYMFGLDYIIVRRR